MLSPLPPPPKVTSVYVKTQSSLASLPFRGQVTVTGFLENQDLGSEIEDRGSRIEDRGSRIEDRGSRIEDRGSRIDDQRSRIEDQGLRIEDRESRIEDRIKKRAMKSQKFVAGLLDSRCCYRLGSLVILQHLF